MTHERWWSQLTPESRTWLIDNNGDAVPESIAAEVSAAGGPTLTSQGSTDAHFEDDVTDWIEETANRE
jgi:hypothetical protein